MAHQATRALLPHSVSVSLVIAAGLIVFATHFPFQNDARIHGAVVTESGAYFIVDNERVPRFGAAANAGGLLMVSSVQNGAWSNPTTWSNNAVPTANDIVVARHAVTVAGTPIAYSVSIENGGSVVFSRTQNTTFSAVNIQVLTGGRLDVGNTASPIPAGITAAIVLRDAPLSTGTGGALGIDPYQWGVGLTSVNGTVTMHGESISETFVRLAQEPKAGAVTLTFTSPVAWRVGDQIIVPDTRRLKREEYGAAYVPKWEERTIAAISPDRRTITLNQPLTFDHLGGRDGAGALRFLPHIGNLSRNITVTSSPLTALKNHYCVGGEKLTMPQQCVIRGHTAFMGRSNVDIRYVRFSNLGRTDNESSQDDSRGSPVTIIGANHYGRYPLNMKSLIGPLTPQANGYQFTLIGNSVEGGSASHRFKFGINIERSHYGLVQNNVVYNMNGAGISLYIGNESMNVIEKNFVMRIPGEGWKPLTMALEKRSLGGGGHGYYIKGINNFFRDNVATTAGIERAQPGLMSGHEWQSGYAMYGNTIATTVPIAQGKDPTINGNFVIIPEGKVRVREFSRNEAYGAMALGLGTDQFGFGQTGSITSVDVDRFVAWNVTFIGVRFGSRVSSVLLTGATLLGSGGTVGSGVGFEASENPATRLFNNTIEGFQYGVRTPGQVEKHGKGVQGTFLVQGGTLRNATNILVNTVGKYNTGWGTPPRRVVLDTINFEMLTPSTRHIHMQLVIDDYRNLVQLDEVIVTNFDRRQGDNFQVFYPEQSPSFFVPRTYTKTSMPHAVMIGAPVAGLTNAQLWNSYKLAVAGQITPCSNAASGAMIIGFTCPITTAQRPPRLVIEYPATGSTLNTPTFPLYLDAYGDQTGFHHIGVQLDNGPVNAMANTGYLLPLYNIAPGRHVLKVHMARSDNSVIAGSQFETTFVVAGTASSSISSIPSSSSSASSTSSSSSESVPRGMCLAMRLQRRVSLGQHQSLAGVNVTVKSHTGLVLLATVPSPPLTSTGMIAIPAAQTARIKNDTTTSYIVEARANGHLPLISNRTNLLQGCTDLGVAITGDYDGNGAISTGDIVRLIAFYNGNPDSLLSDVHRTAVGLSDIVAIIANYVGALGS